MLAFVFIAVTLFLFPSTSPGWDVVWWDFVVVVVDSHVVLSPGDHCHFLSSHCHLPGIRAVRFFLFFMALFVCMFVVVLCQLSLVVKTLKF